MGYTVYDDCTGVDDPTECKLFNYTDCGHAFNDSKVIDYCPALCLKCPIPISLKVILGLIVPLTFSLVAILAYKGKFQFHRATLDVMTIPWKQYGITETKTLSHKILPWTRLFSFLYTFGIMISGLAEGPLEHWNFKFFTIWNYFTLICVFGALALHSFAGKYLPSWFTKITWSLYQIELCNAIGLDLTFWILLYAPVGGPVEWQMVNVHGINSIFLAVEFYLNSIELVLAHAVFVTLYASIYCVVTWILYLDFAYTMPYPFMNVGVAAAPVWYLALMIAFPLVFVNLWLLSKRKFRIINRNRAKLGLSCNSDNVDAIYEDNEPLLKK